MYPIVVASFEFHGSRFQIWNDRERLCLVVDKTYTGDPNGPIWERVTLLSI